MLESVEELADVDLDSVADLNRREVVKERQHGSRFMVLVYTFTLREVIE
jgi:hypothetical protein